MRFPYFVLAGALATAVALPIVGAAQQTPQTGSTQAGPQSGTVGTHHHRGGMMGALRQLNLTQDQQSQIKTLMTNFHQAHPKGSAPDKAAMEQLHQQVMAILTPDQQKQLQTIMQQQRQHHAGGQGNQGAENGGPFRPDATPSPSPAP